MAKAKKQEKPIEQRLEEALVLYEKTPYELPSNWCWTRLIHLVNHQSGNSKLIKGKLSSEKTDGLYDGYSASGQDVFCPNYEHEGEAIIVSAVGARCGKAFLAKGKWSAIANTHIVYPKSGMNIKFLFYLMNDEEWWVRSGSAQPFVVVKESLERPFALPPQEEQKRIVEIIDKQFAKLDEARDLIQKSLDSFADRKSAILHKAFTGELTKQWREQHDIEYKWRSVSLSDVSHSFQYGTSKKSEKQGKCIVVRMGNLQQGKIDWNDLVYTNDEADIEKYRLKNGDVLFNRTNSAELVGKTSIFEWDRLAIFAGYLIRINYRKELLSGRFLNYLLNSMKAKEYCMSVKSDAVNQSNINSKKLAAFTFDLPGLDEQEEIVRILDSIFEKEDKSKELLDMLDKIDEMKKSILARAFRGQLGTSNPTDEPATDFLRKILEYNNV